MFHFIDVGTCQWKELQGYLTLQYIKRIEARAFKTANGKLIKI